MTLCLRNSTLCLLALSLQSGCDLGELVLPREGAGSQAAGPRASAPLDPHRTLVQTLGRVARVHEAALLKPLTTDRLAASLDETLRQDSGRLWRHLDGLSAGIRGGFVLGTPRERPDGRLELPIRFNNGGSASLLIREEHGQPRIDRF